MIPESTHNQGAEVHLNLYSLDDYRQYPSSPISRLLTKVSQYPWTLGWIAVAVTVMLILMVIDYLKG